MLNNINVSGLSEMTQEVMEVPAEGIAKYGIELNWVSGTRMDVKTIPMQLGNYKLVRDFKFEVDEPAQLGGINKAPNPQEYLLAGVASCVAVTFMTGATTNKVAIEHLRIKLEGELDLAGFLGLKAQFHPGFDQLNMNIEIKADASKEVLNKIMDNVKRYSPNFNNMENVVKINPNLIILK